MSTVDELLGAFVGKTIPGGCDSCDAEQTVEPDAEYAGIWHLRIAHDDRCPFLRRRREKTR
jgi:hypothetical protein